MGLPEGLLVYAENIFRRFPEEFIALGCPRLDEDYSLPHATRRITDMGATKSFEITLRKAPRDWSESPQREEKKSPTAAQSANTLTNQVTFLINKIAALESANAKGQATLAPEETARPITPAHQHPTASGLVTPTSALAARRGRDRMNPVQVPAKPALPNDAVRAEAAQESRQVVAVVAKAAPAPVPAPAPAPVATQASKGSKENGRPSLDRALSASSEGLAIRPQRVMPTSDEPESPRSPGWFSAWGK